jgi:hypothetical protein
MSGKLVGDGISGIIREILFGRAAVQDTAAQGEAPNAVLADSRERARSAREMAEGAWGRPCIGPVGDRDAQ